MAHLMPEAELPRLNIFEDQGDPCHLQQQECFLSGMNEADKLGPGVCCLPVVMTRRSQPAVYSLEHEFNEMEYDNSSLQFTGPLPSSNRNDEENGEKLDTSSAAVFSRLGDIFSRRLNVELTNFASNVHELLNDQRGCFQNMMCMSQEAAGYRETEFEAVPSELTHLPNYSSEHDPFAVETGHRQESASTTTESTESSQHLPCEETDEMIKTRYVIQLMTLASALSNALRDEQYTT